MIVDFQLLYLKMLMTKNVLYNVAQQLTIPIMDWQPYNIPENILLTTRMHLNREQIKDIINVLQEWLDTGILN